MTLESLSHEIVDLLEDNKDSKLNKATTVANLIRLRLRENRIQELEDDRIRMSTKIIDEVLNHPAFHLPRRRL